MLEMYSFGLWREWSVRASRLVAPTHSNAPKPVPEMLSSAGGVKFVGCWRQRAT